MYVSNPANISTIKNIIMVNISPCINGIANWTLLEYKTIENTEVYQDNNTV